MVEDEIPTWSEIVVRRTKCPVSVQPPAAERVIALHTIAPLESVVRALVPEHAERFVRKLSAKMPPVNVEVAVPHDRM